MTVEVLGTEYEIIESNNLKDMNLNNADGYCDSSIKRIVIDTFQDLPGTLANLEAYKKQVLRHEVVHAFLFESGLDTNSWGGNEEIVDWIACQFPKMIDVFKKINAI